MFQGRFWIYSQGLMRFYARLLVCLSLIALAPFVMSSHVLAGELRATGAQKIDPETYDPEPNAKCDHRFDGPFEIGDFDKFKRAEITLLCLNSPGGALVEALKIAELMNEYGNAIATKIEQGAICESACALVFMAGSFVPHESEKYTWRVLHPQGKLGFHAPDILIPDGSYTEATVKKAYGIALKSISETINSLVVRIGFDKPAMKSSLLGKMLDTPPDDMFYIETVDHAGRWEVDVGPLPEVRNPAPEHLVDACVNHTAWLADEPAPIRNRISTDNWWPTNSNDRNFQTSEVYTNEMFQLGCNFTMDRQGRVTAEFKNSGRFALSPFGYFKPKTKLIDIYRKRARLSSGPWQKPGIAANQPVSQAPSNPAPTSQAPANNNLANGATGACRVYDRAGRLSDSEPCRHTGRAKSSGYVNVFEWPSGSKTTVEVVNNILYINGNRTNPAEEVNGQICVVNPRSGNSFCYEKY